MDLARALGLTHAGWTAIARFRTLRPEAQPTQLSVRARGKKGAYETHSLYTQSRPRPQFEPADMPEHAEMLARLARVDVDKHRVPVWLYHPREIQQRTAMITAPVDHIQLATGVAQPRRTILRGASARQRTDFSSAT